MICQISLFISRLLLSLSIPKAKESSTVSTQARLFFRLGKHQKSPSVVPLDFADTETIESSTESEAIADLSADDLKDDSLKSPQESLDLVDSGDVAEAGADAIELDWDPLAKEANAEGESIDDLAKELTTDKESVAATQKVLANELKEESADVVVSGADGADGEGGANGVEAVASPEPVAEDIPAVEDVKVGDVKDVVVENVEEVEEVAIAEDKVPDNLENIADETLDTSEDQDVGETKEESDLVADIADEVADAESKESEQEELEIIGDSLDTEPNLLSQVESGFYTVDATGKVEFTFIFDSGAYQGQLAAISMTGMENLDLNSQEFFREALQRALYGSEAKLGYIVIDDINDGAMFGGELETGADYNHGEFAGTTIVEFRAGDKFFLMLIPNGSVAEVEAALETGTTKDVRPLFSLVAANPTKAIQMGQIADVTGDGNTYVFEDIRQDGASDKDFNDLIFQVKGATIKTVTLDELILEGEMSPEADWRNTEIGQQIVDYAASQVVLAPEPNPVEKYEFPKTDQPLIGFIDTHFTKGNPDIDYSRIIFGKDYIQNDSDPTVVAVAGEGTHGDHILGIVAATQDNGKGIDGLNDDAPLWVSSAVESGKWADALVEFVDAAKASNQPNAIINLSIDLTQVNPDGSVTTRYEFTPQERGAIEYARQNGVLIVAAAGNDGGVMSVLGQASQEFDNIITVGAVKSTVVPGALPEFTKAEYSSFGNGLDVMAEGGTVDNPVISTAGDSLGLMAGTSVAAAKVTGVASQVWAANPELSYRQVISILEQSATDLGATGWDADTGFGLVNIVAAVGLAKTTIPEIYKPTPWFAPDTWSGAGVVTPAERAVGSLNISSWGRHQYFGSSNSTDELSFNVSGSTYLQFTIDGGSIRVVDSSGRTLASTSSSVGKVNLGSGSYRLIANYSSSFGRMIKVNFDDRPTTHFDSQRTIPTDPIFVPPQPPAYTDGVGFDGSTYRMTYRNTYFNEGGQSALGTRKENVFRNGAGYMQHFIGGYKGSGAIMKSDQSDASYWVGGEIWNKYIQSGAINSLGYPISAAYSVNGYPFQRFQYGDISLAPAFNDRVGYDGSNYNMTYRNTYFNEGGQSALGTPKENVFRNGAGYMQQFINGSKGNGAIMKSDVSDASYWVGGEIWKKFNEGGSINRYGYPISAVSYRGGVPFQQFQKGIVQLAPFPGENKVPSNAVYVNTVASTTPNGMTAVNYSTGQLAVQPISNSSSWYEKGTAIMNSITNSITNLIPKPSKNINLVPGTTLTKGQERTTPSGYKFIFQTDGNLVMRDPKGNPIWATGTNGKGADRFSVQNDGNVVLYAGKEVLWATGTDNKNNLGAYFSIQDDGNLVVYSSDKNPLFNTGTNNGKQGTLIASQQWLNRLPTSASAAKPFFLTQFKSNYNTASGIPLNSCGPASLTIVLRTLGIKPSGTFSNDFSDLANIRLPDGNTLPSGLIKGAERNGLSAEWLSGWEALDKSLTLGRPVILYGDITAKWRNKFPLGYGDGGTTHYNTILGKTPDGKKYIVADPMSRGGPVEMTKEEVMIFCGEAPFVPATGGGGFISISKK